MSPSPAVIAVLDVGKTNLKILVASADGKPLETLSAPNRSFHTGTYLACDLSALEDFFLDGLAQLAPRHAIGAVVATAHGCGAVLVDADRPVLPMMDYESPTPRWLDAAYEQEAPRYGEVFCSIGPGASRLAKQLLWQEAAFPEAFGRATHYLTLAQYIAWRLGGRPASEISQLAAQGHIWASLRNDVSSIMRRKGWDRLLPPLAKAGEVLGTLTSAVAARTGLPATVQVLCGVHDSNANFFRYKAAGMAQASVLSTGTWMIGFNRGKPLATLDPRYAMVANVDVDGEAIASTLTMTGREYAVLAGDAVASDDEALAAAQALVERGTTALPSFVEDDGAFPGRSNRGAIVGPPPQNAAERRALAALYAAFYADLCLTALDSSTPIVIDGGFAGNFAFSRLLAALRPDVPVSMSRSREGTALGAALLWKRFERREPVTTVALDRAAPYSLPGLKSAAVKWARRATEADRR